jgi:hypothetical protein
MTSGLEAYLARLAAELATRGLAARRIVDEAREHLADELEQGVKRGLSLEDAQREALARFGPADVVAEQFASEGGRTQMWNRVLFGVRLAFRGVLAVTLLRHQRNWALLQGTDPVTLHDVPNPIHFRVKSKRGWRNPEFLAIVSNPDAELVPFLERVAPPLLAPLGPVQSVALVDEQTKSGRVTRRYRAVFGDRANIVCTAAFACDGTALSLDWTRLGLSK